MSLTNTAYIAYITALMELPEYTVLPKDDYVRRDTGMRVTLPYNGEYYHITCPKMIDTKRVFNIGSRKTWFVSLTWVGDIAIIEQIHPRTAIGEIKSDLYIVSEKHSLKVCKDKFKENEPLYAVRKKIITRLGAIVAYHKVLGGLQYLDDVLSM